MKTERLIESLRDPSAYPRPPSAVEVLQTHASVLFFAGDLVYKVKKTVNLGFLDFSTLERRREACAEEVRLNAALAPGVYRRVVPIARLPDGRLRIDGPGDAVEYAVEMVRLPADRMLDRLLETGGADAGLIRRISGALATFHAHADAGPEVARHGTAGSIRRRIARNLAEIAGFAGPLPDAPRPDSPVLSTCALEHVRAWNDGVLCARHDLLASRVAAGRIVDGHGDLHAGNVCLTSAPEARGTRVGEGWGPHRPSPAPGSPSPTAEDAIGGPDPAGGVVIYDRIEFDGALRCCDVAAELAFLAMDLDRHGRRDLSLVLVEDYSARTGDPDLLKLQDLYRCHYAVVRGKVAAIRARQPGRDEPGAVASWREAACHVQLAAGYTLPVAIILMCGLPGTGKSWAARNLTVPLGAQVIASDRVRKELAGVPATQRGNAGLYAQAMTARTYAAMLERARAILAQGRTVLLDATFSTRLLRAAFLDLSRATGAPLVVVHLTAPLDVIRRRMAERLSDRAEVSDADLPVHEAARHRFEPPDEVPASCTVTSGPVSIPERLVQRVIDALVTRA